MLVTGGAGFIGSNVADAYIEAGHDVAIVDNLFTGKRENVNPKARFYELDIRSKELSKIISDERPEVISHHAAQMSVPASVEDPAFDADVNVMGLINVLESARKNGVRKVVFISSGGAVYGEVPDKPATEDYPLKPMSPYAITKGVAEKYLEFYRHAHGLDYTVLRYANIYGPRQVPHGEAGVVAIFMDNLLAGKPCTVYAFEDEPRGMVRDYCFVGDVVRANLFALDKGSGKVFNIGTGKGTHTMDLFDSIYSAVRRALPEVAAPLGVPDKGPARAGDLKRSCLDASFAAKELGWRPLAGLDEGLARTLDWRIRTMR